MNETSPDGPGGKYEALDGLGFREVSTGLEQLELVRICRQMGYNDGLLLKTVEPDDKETFKAILQSVLKPVEPLDFNLKFQRTIADANDFLFHLVCNESLQAGGWGIHEDDADFLWLADAYNSPEKFRTLSLAELNLNKLQDRLYTELREGGFYLKWPASDRHTEELVYEFVSTILPKEEAHRAFEFGDWRWSRSWTSHFFLWLVLVNIDRAQVTFFAKDDSD